MSTLNVIERSKNFVHLAFTRDPNVVRFRILVARTLNNAYVGQGISPLNGVAGLQGTDPILVVEQGSDLISTALRRRRLGVIEESNKGLTYAKFDPDEFVGLGAPAAPPDQDIMFMRIQEFRVVTGAYAAEGAIHVVPNSNFYTVPKPSLSLAGTPPIIAGTVAGINPLPGSMVIVQPRFMGPFSLTNTGAASLFVSFNEGMPMREVPTTDTAWSDGDSEFLIIAAAAATSFSFFGAVQNAWR